MGVKNGIPGTESALQDEAQRKGGVVVGGQVLCPPEFDEDQVKQIRKGIEAGLDVSVYAKPEFDRVQMRQIRRGLEAGLDVSVYAKPEFDWGQMKAKREALSGATKAPKARRGSVAPGM